MRSERVSINEAWAASGKLEQALCTGAYQAA